MLDGVDTSVTTIDSAAGARVADLQKTAEQQLRVDIGQRLHSVDYITAAQYERDKAADQAKTAAQAAGEARATLIDAMRPQVVNKTYVNKKTYVTSQVGLINIAP